MKTTKNFPISSTAGKAIELYLDTRKHSPDEPLFISRKRNGDKMPRAISRVRAYLVINEAARTVGIKDKIGTHTMRKTFGYHAYQAGKDITIIQKLLNHSSARETMRYIGITQDELDDVYLNLNL